MRASDVVAGLEDAQKLLPDLRSTYQRFYSPIKGLFLDGPTDRTIELRRVFDAISEAKKLFVAIENGTVRTSAWPPRRGE